MKLSFRGLTLLLAIALLLTLGGIPALAQTSSAGAISGIILDQQGAAIPGVNVKINDSSTNTTLETITNDAGRYLFPAVPPATYNIVFTKPGFNARRVNKQTVSIGGSLTINGILEVGQVSNVVEVTAAPGAELQTVNASVGTSISGASLTLLPLFGSDVASLANYQPGVSPEGAPAGAMYDQNTFQLDGGNNSNDMDGSMRSYTGSYSRSGYAGMGGSGSAGPPSGVLPTPGDTVEEIKISTSGQTADFNGASGSQIQVVTKRGTNDFHGSAYYYYSSSNVGGANTWDNNHTPDGNLGATPIPISHNQRYGFTVGGPMLPKMLGGKTYFFFGLEGFNFNNSAIINKPVPTALLRAGVISIDQGGTYVPYNLNPSPVTVNGVTYQPAVCSNGPCDPRGVGLNPVVSQIWNKFMPMPNNTNTGDGNNIEGYQGQVLLPEKTKALVGRVDHDFGDKWRLFSSYRYYGLSQATENQIDIGGALPGDKFGVPTSRSPRPQKPEFMVVGLSTTINPTMTNDFHWNFTKTWWQWASSGAPPQLPGLGGAVEIGGETQNPLMPYNTDNQNTRQRFWDGHDTTWKDDLTKIKSNHVIQFGGTYQHNFDYHERNDNGVGININPTYQIGRNNFIDYSAYQPAGLPTGQQINYNTLYTYVTGLVDQPQQLFTRSGANLSLNPVGTPMFDKSTIDFYNAYITDSWKIKPTLTLTYGASYTVEMPPVEQNGKQVELVDTSGHPVEFSNYFATKAAQALQGQVYNPILGFSTIGNVSGASHKYPFNPFYGGVSPRGAIAWNPKGHDGMLGKLLGDGKTVIRAGYGQIYSRLNGVGLVLVPLLGVGLGQPVSCIGASSSGQCLGTNGVTPANAFRIGTDGLVAPIPTPSATLPQPSYPGVNGQTAAGAASVLDPNFKPATTYNVNFSIQREIKPRMLIEVGYIGRVIKNEWMQTDLNAVPTMMTLNGQSFAQAFANTYWAVNAGGVPAPQPFFEAALGGASSSFCKGYGSCTAAVAKNSTMNSYISTTDVFYLWSALEHASSWQLGRTIPSSTSAAIPSGQMSSVNADGSFGSGNYNAVYETFTTKDWHGITTTSNFTWGRALGTGNQAQATSGYTAVNPYNIRQSMYGPQNFDYKFLYSQTFLWSEPFFKDSNRIVKAALGGWRLGTIFTARDGAPIQVLNDSNNDSFGESQTSASLDNAVLASKYTGGSSAVYNVNVPNSASGAGVNSNTANGGTSINMFANPNAVYGEFRNCVLGFDTSCGTNGNIRGLPSWNMDANLAKDFNLFRERVFATLSFQFTNVFNHAVLGDPEMAIGDPANFGVLGSNNPLNGGQINSPRQLTFNLRMRF